jgi:hypothetical protein
MGLWGAKMTTLVLSCRVADYDAWRPRYDSAVERITDIRSWRIWRGQDDPKFVVIEETYESREIPERLIASDEMKAEMESDDVDLSSVQVYLLDEVGSGSR